MTNYFYLVTKQYNYRCVWQLPFILENYIEIDDVFYWFRIRQFNGVGRHQAKLSNICSILI